MRRGFEVSRRARRCRRERNRPHRPGALKLNLLIYYSVVSTSASGLNSPFVKSGAVPRVRTQIRPHPPPPPPLFAGFGMVAGDRTPFPSRNAPVPPTLGG